MEHIPVISLTRLRQGNTRESEINKIAEAFSTIGFVTLTDHGISSEHISRLYEASKSFFALPEAIKGKYEITGLAGQRAYTSFGKEHAKGQSEGDLKEFWHFGQPNPSQISRDVLLENIECEEVPEFNSEGLYMYEALEQIGIEVLSAIAIFLDLGEDYFNPYVKGGNSILRAIHYPPILSEPKSAIRAAEHEDINLITLLIGSSADGLQVKSLKGKWVPVEAGYSDLVINVGDMLQRLSNGRLKSTTHRVVNPPREFWNQPRYSMPFFLHPISEMPLNALPGCINETNPKQYADITAGEFLRERLQEIGLLSK